MKYVSSSITDKVESRMQYQSCTQINQHIQHRIEWQIQRQVWYQIGSQLGTRFDGILELSLFHEK